MGIEETYASLMRKAIKRKQKEDLLEYINKHRLHTRKDELLQLFNDGMNVNEMINPYGKLMV